MGDYFNVKNVIMKIHYVKKMQESDKENIKSQHQHIVEDVKKKEEISRETVKEANKAEDLNKTKDEKEGNFRKTSPKKDDEDSEEKEEDTKKKKKHQNYILDTYNKNLKKEESPHEGDNIDYEA